MSYCGNREGVDLRPVGLVDTSKPNCGVVSVAVVLDEEYGKIENLFRTLNSKHGNWNGKTRFSDWNKVVQHYGKTLCHVEGLPRKKVETVCSYLDPNKRFLVRTGGHLMAFVNGMLVDQSGTWDIDHFLRRRKIVVNVYAVVESDEEVSSVEIPEKKEPESNFKYALYIDDILYKKYKRMPNKKTVNEWLRYGCKVTIYDISVHDFHLPDNN